MIYVTHDQVEAMTLADRIVVLEFGRIAQVGTPRALYDRPANLFVAQFIGSPKMNVMPCKTAEGRYLLEGGRGGPFDRQGKAARVGVRPEHVRAVPQGEGACDGVVDLMEFLGADTFVIVDAGPLGRITLREVGEADLRAGDRIGLAFDKLHFFDADGHSI